MQTDIKLEDIEYILSIAGVNGFTGKYVSLGGGEINNTYLLNLEDKKVILRVAKDEGQTTLMSEAWALKLLDLANIPKLIFFDENIKVKNRLWILESYIPGRVSPRLNTVQFNNLGKLLAEVHKVKSIETRVNLKEQFLEYTEAFGNEQFLLNHPHKNLRDLINQAFAEFKELQPFYDTIEPSYIHLDATPSNILVNGDKVGLIDWEFSKFNDPMADFSTVYYEDIEYNRGKWRIKIKQNEKVALFQGYESAGGKIDENRIRYWIKFDKLGAAVFLYWRLHESKRVANSSQLEQYQKR